MSDDMPSGGRIMLGECPIEFNLEILSKADLQSTKKAENDSRSPLNLNNDFLGNHQTASTKARASPNDSEQFDGVTIDVQAQMVDGKARDAPNSDAVHQTKPPPLEVMGFVNTPNRIQNGECPILLLNGARAPDRSILNVTPNEVETKEYGQYSILQGSNSGQVYETSLSLLKSNEVPTLAEFYHHLGGKYYKSETEYLYLNGKGDYIPMTDFLVKVESRVTEKDTDGTTKDYISFKCMTLTAGGRLKKSYMTSGVAFLPSSKAKQLTDLLPQTKLLYRDLKPLQQ